jgi:hypothetical protein
MVVADKVLARILPNIKTNREHSQLTGSRKPFILVSYRYHPTITYLPWRSTKASSMAKRINYQNRNGNN